MRWPAAIAAGTVVEHTITNLDWFPTLLSLCGVPLPADAFTRSPRPPLLNRIDAIAQQEELSEPGALATPQFRTGAGVGGGTEVDDVVGVARGLVGGLEMAAELVAHRR